MNNPWIYNAIADRLGGARFEQNLGYKFEQIKQAKRDFLAKNPHRKLLDFGVGEPLDVPPQEVIKTLQATCGLLEYNGYADNGADFFKESVQRYMQNLLDVALDKDEILPILGIKSGLTLLAGTLINPGDWIAYAIPGYGVFATQARYFGGETYTLPLTPERQFLPDLEAIPEEIKHKIKVLSLNYPNNPTGGVATTRFYEHVVEMALRYHWIVLQDAAYTALSFEKPLSILQIPQAKTCCIELHSMSKGFNMTVWRLGWLCGNKTLVKACGMYKNNCDSGQFLAIQKASCAGLDNADMWLPKLRQKYKERLEHLTHILEQNNFQCYAPSAGFFLYVASPKSVSRKADGSTISFANAQAFSQWLLNELGIVVVPWDDSGAYVRFSVTFGNTDEIAYFKGLQERLSPFIFK